MPDLVLRDRSLKLTGPSGQVHYIDPELVAYLSRHGELTTVGLSQGQVLTARETPEDIFAQWDEVVVKIREAWETRWKKKARRKPRKGDILVADTELAKA